MYYINYKDGFVTLNSIGGMGNPSTYCRNAKRFSTWDEADKFAKSCAIGTYAILKS